MGLTVLGRQFEWISFGVDVKTLFRKKKKGGKAIVMNSNGNVFESSVMILAVHSFMSIHSLDTYSES